jgi:hypothetical protein
MDRYCSSAAVAGHRAALGLFFFRTTLQPTAATVASMAYSILLFNPCKQPLIFTRSLVAKFELVAQRCNGYIMRMLLFYRNNSLLCLRFEPSSLKKSQRFGNSRIDG